MAVPSGKQPEPSALARAFSALVRMAMARDHVTAQGLADMTGISRSYLGKRLRDEVPFTLNDVEAVSKALKIDLPDLPEL